MPFKEGYFLKLAGAENLISLNMVRALAIERAKPVSGRLERIRGPQRLDFFFFATFLAVFFAVFFEVFFATFFVLFLAAFFLEAFFGAFAALATAFTGGFLEAFFDAAFFDAFLVFFLGIGVSGTGIS
jgi:hypothetical protein